VQPFNVKSNLEQTTGAFIAQGVKMQIVDSEVRAGACEGGLDRSMIEREYP